MPILLTSDRDGIAVTGAEALSLIAAGAAVVDGDDGEAAAFYHHQTVEIPMPRSYPWPCSKIDRDLMHELHCESKKNGVPITAIIAEAVGTYLNAKLEQQAVTASPQPDHGPASNAA
jgi:hypothetical protein